MVRAWSPHAEREPEAASEHRREQRELIMSGSFQVSGGWMEVVAGSMFSGKTEELLRRVRRATIARKRVQVFLLQRLARME